MKLKWLFLFSLLTFNLTIGPTLLVQEDTEGQTEEEEEETLPCRISVSSWQKHFSKS
jgi:hypothetical protein